ncbi:phage holin family protein [Providencia rettgeri]|uniref:phage holin family protein n=1 Tax=Providencia rettgeri TaxID=587 RepID=UPI0015EC6A72|nr:phage holin family protein [Providencia rettgeri]QLR03797.1 phage holin family protein [Providencia rettgeri]
MCMHEKYSSPFSYALGVITTAAGALSLDQWAVLIGIICTVATFLVNWYYKRKEFKLREDNSGKDTK